MLVLAQLDGQDLALIGAVLAGVQVLVQLGDRLWKRRAGEGPAAQSAACHYEHAAMLEQGRRLEHALERLVEAQTALLSGIAREHAMAKARHGEVLRTLDQQEGPRT